MPNRLYKYVITLRHDFGGFIIGLKARNKDAARRMVKAVEGCPDRAITSIIRTPKRK